MTFQEFHDAMKALCPPGGSFSAGMTAWSHDGGARESTDYHASVHLDGKMLAHESNETTPEATVASVAKQLGA